MAELCANWSAMAGGGVAGFFHSQGKSLKGFGHDPGIEGAHGGSRVANEGFDFGLAEFFGCQDCAAEAASLSVNVFGGGIDHDVCAVCKGILQSR